MSYAEDTDHAEQVDQAEEDASTGLTDYGDWKRRYTLNKSQPNGAPLVCPVCRAPFNKHNGKVFCSNWRDKKDNCKDRFWNQLGGLLQ